MNVRVFKICIDFLGAIGVYVGLFLGYFYYLPAYRPINLVKTYIARTKVTKYLVHNRFG
jgi:hypothetical protein